MTRMDFSLRSGKAEPIRDMPVPGELTIPVRGMTVKAARGKQLPKGGAVAISPAPMAADAHTSLAGKVAKISFAYVHIKVGGDESVEPVDLEACGDERDLRRALRRLGVNMQAFPKAEVLVVNGLNKEPECAVSEALLANERATILEGLAWARRLVEPKRCVLASSGEPGICELDGCETVVMRPEYPFSLDPLVCKAVTGREDREGVAVVDAPVLWELGMAASTGLPVTETVVTIDGHNWRMPVGTPVQWALEQAGVPVEEGDVVRLGGPMRGLAAFSLDQGVPRGVRGLGVVPAHAVAKAQVENVPCINCGECVQHCPARLMPNLVTRYAEYDRFEDARRAGLDRCFECGLCAHYCTARRPLLHLIRFAKEQLRQSR